MDEPTMHDKEATVAVVFESPASSDPGHVKKPLAIDAAHNDQAITILANYTGDLHWDPAEEKRLKRKIDRRVLSILCVTFALQYYDKTIIAQAVSLILLRFIASGGTQRY